jgi:epoxyqueuosine reductase
MTSSEIKTHARRLGFDICGIAPAIDHLELHSFGRMAGTRIRRRDGYLHRSAERRADVRHVMPSAQSVIVTGTLYNNTGSSYDGVRRSRSRADRAYAWGDDYHDVIGARLESLLA